MNTRPLSLPANPLALDGTLLDGSAFDHGSLAGKVVLIDFWASWCGPCVAEIPRVRDAYDRYHDRGFAVVSISRDGVVLSIEARGRRLEELLEEQFPEADADAGPQKWVQVFNLHIPSPAG